MRAAQAARNLCAPVNGIQRRAHIEILCLSFVGTLTALPLVFQIGLAS
jgi:hypothetical protein